MYADTKDDAFRIGQEELLQGSADTFYIDKRSFEVDLLEWEDEA